MTIREQAARAERLSLPIRRTNRTRFGGVIAAAAADAAHQPPSLAGDLRLRSADGDFHRWAGQPAGARAFDGVVRGHPSAVLVRAVRAGPPLPSRPRPHARANLRRRCDRTAEQPAFRVRTAAADDALSSKRPWLLTGTHGLRRI